MGGTAENGEAGHENEVSTEGVDFRGLFWKVQGKGSQKAGEDKEACLKGGGEGRDKLEKQVKQMRLMTAGKATSFSAKQGKGGGIGKKKINGKKRKETTGTSCPSTRGWAKPRKEIARCREKQHAQVEATRSQRGKKNQKGKRRKEQQKQGGGPGKVWEKWNTKRKSGGGKRFIGRESKRLESKKKGTQKPKIRTGGKIEKARKRSPLQIETFAGRQQRNQGKRENRKQKVVWRGGP